jgi:hypothetical protein
MTLNYHLWGHKIVHPSATFEPKATLQALAQEKSSDLSGTPEMYNGILTLPDFEKKKKDKFRESQRTNWEPRSWKIIVAWWRMKWERERFL